MKEDYKDINKLTCDLKERQRQRSAKFTCEKIIIFDAIRNDQFIILLDEIQCNMNCQ